MSVVFDDPGDSPEFGFLDYNYLGVEIKYFIIPYPYAILLSASQ